MTKYNKKIFASILAAVIAVGMFGCSQKNEQESSGQTTQETSDELARKKTLQPLMFRLVVPTKISVLFGQTNGHKSKRKALPAINRDVHFWKIWITMEQKS